MEILSPAPKSTSAPPSSVGISLTRSLAALLLRTGLGLTLILFHGIPESRLAWGFVWDDRAWPLVDYARALMVPFPQFLTPAAVALGLAAAVAVVLGLLTRVASALLLALMAVAAAGLLRPPGSPLAEVAIVYISGFAALVATGSGIFSLDAILSRKPRPPKKRPLA